MTLPTPPNSWTPWVDAASIVAIPAAIAKTFDWLDGLLSDEGRVALWYYLANVPADDRIDSWGKIFPGLIDKIFGPRTISFRFILTSTIASLIAVMSTAAVLFRFQGGDHDFWHLSQYLLSAVTFGLVANVIPDYVSLIVSKTIVSLIARKPSLTRIMSLLTVDTVLTLTIGGIAFYIYLYEVGPMIRNSMHELVVIEVQERVRALSGHPDDALTAIMYRLSGVRSLTSVNAAIFFCSSIFTSMWLWLYVGSSVVIKLIHKVRPLWIEILPYLDIEKKPMQAVGRIAGVMAGIVWALILGSAWLIHHLRH